MFVGGVLGAIGGLIGVEVREKGRESIETEF
jgi:hypothetical protein